MKTINYALAGGNKTLLQVQAIDKTVAAQFVFSGIVAANVSIEVWASTDKSGPWSKIEGATKLLVPANGNEMILLSGTSFIHIQFRLITAGVTVGKVDSVEFQAAVNPIY